MADGAGAPIALVTGANSGIGRAVVDALLASGRRVIAGVRRPEALETLLGELAPAAGEGRALGVALDVEDHPAASSLVERLPEGWREIDVLVSNAGHDRGGQRRFDEVDPASVASVINANLLGAMLVTRAVLGGMVERDRGHIVIVSSVQGEMLLRNTAMYAASKFGLHGFAQSLRLDFNRTGIRVSEVMPGAVKTSFAANRWGDPARAEAFYAAMEATMAPADVAAAVLYALDQPAHVDVGQLVVHAHTVARPAP